MGGEPPIFDIVAPPVAALALLIWLNSLVLRVVVTLVYTLVRDLRLALLVYALLVLPGTIIHELSHWLMATLLGVRASLPVVIPRNLSREVKAGGTITLGYVMVAETDIVRRSLIGVAPFVAGSGLVAWIARAAFAGEVPVAVGFAGAWETLLALITGLWGMVQARQDGWLYLYLIFAIANGMLPSASDREAWPTLALLGAVALGVVAFFFGLPTVSEGVIVNLLTLVAWLTFALLVTIVIDVASVLVTWPVAWFVGKLFGQR